MATLALVLVLFVAALHVFFFVLEALLWTKPLGRKVFGTKEAFAKETRALAANQGLYNLFLAAGLGWGVYLSGGTARHSAVLFFLGCVIVAGVFGALTVNPRIFLVQGLPAAVALALVLAM